MLEGKKILLGISGSIAAYKTAALARLFVKAGAEVQVVMTEAAHDFVTPLTLSTLTGKPVYTQFTKDKLGQWVNHVELGLWADIMLVAPASANTLAKMCHGICDNLLLACYLSARCQVWVAPAMDLDMYAHQATQQNLSLLKARGVKVIDPEEGELASGLVGKGRMAEPENIVAALEGFYQNKGRLHGKQILVTAGPTYEHIDPVRFVGNHSSGKMGFAIAEAFASHGAQVTLITGPTHEEVKNKLIKRIDVTSAGQMYEATIKAFKKCHVAVMSAAVADYTPEKVSISKIKKSGDTLQLTLKKTKDILKELGGMKTAKQLLVGFALETDNEEANARKKLKDKNLDCIVLNSLKQQGAGFGFDTNQVSIIRKNGEIVKFGLKPKHQVAQDIVEQVISLLHV